MLRLVSENHESPQEQIAEQVRALADMIAGGLNIEHGLIVGVIDGCVSYAPLGTITLVQATGLLELASRKVERDLS